MTARSAESIVHDLAQFPGVVGCALVETDSGMVWYHAGTVPDVDRIAEASIEFWRTPIRLSSSFSSMGSLQSTAYSFSKRVVSLFPCSDQPPLVLICIAQKGKVMWSEWGLEVQALKKALKPTPTN